MNRATRENKTPEVRIHLVRHGESEWQTGDDSGHDSRLSVRGRRQAEQLAERINAGGISPPNCMVLASPLRRSIETVECLGKPFAVLESLKEARFDIKAHLPKFDGPAHHRPDALPRDEYLSFQTDVAALLGQLVSKVTSGNADLLAFTHGGVIKTLLRTIHGTSSVCYRIDNCSLSTIAWYHGRWHVECLNDVSHVSMDLRS